MFKQVYTGSIGKVNFFTQTPLDKEQAKEYAMSQLQGGNYKNCIIGQVNVNGQLVLENIKIK